MCGRFSLSTPPARVARLFHATLAADVEDQWRPRWNIGPTSPVLGVRGSRADEPGRAADHAAGLASDHEPGRAADHAAARLLDVFRWGLVPSWAKDLSAGNRRFNARAETVATKPSFRSAFTRRRLVVPADGFFEWEKAPAGRRRPHYFYRVDDTPMALAGVWEVWRDPRDPEAVPVRSCAILTTDADDDMGGVHDRMPVVLEPELLDLWLDPAADPDELLGLLRSPHRPGTLTHHLVDPRVGNVRHDDPSVVAAVGAGQRQAAP